MVNLIRSAIPFFFILIFIELFVSYLIKRRVYRYADSINDLSMGIIDTVGGVFLRSIVGAGYVYLYHNHRLFDISATSVGAAIACLLAYDLMYY
ncbi:MAG: sterol desaturase, partial [Candidatus Hydrogenedentes bacterium]|nr:sterol desaturase [Candidatus Hydrogenedentota bacterium]